MSACPTCRNMHPDFRGDAGHLKLDPETGATVLVPHDEPTFHINSIVDDQGTIVVFGTTEGPWIAVDHRMAQPIADALAAGESPEVGPEPWQVLGQSRSEAY